MYNYGKIWISTSTAIGYEDLKEWSNGDGVHIQHNMEVSLVHSRARIARLVMLGELSQLYGKHEWPPQILK